MVLSATAKAPASTANLTFFGSTLREIGFFLWHINMGDCYAQGKILWWFNDKS